MTLNFKKLLKNGITKQLQIQHVELPEDNVQIFKREELEQCEQVAGKMKSLYGENFLLDGDYMIFFSNAGTDIKFEGDFLKKTLFKVINFAAGNSANNMKEDEIRVFAFGKPEKQSAPESPAEDADSANAAAISGMLESVENPAAGEKFAFVKITMK